MKKKKRKLKVRNWILLCICLILCLCVLLEISYTSWIFSGGPAALKYDSSEEVKLCYQKHHPLLSDCLFFMAEKNQEEFVKINSQQLRYIGTSPNNYIDLGERYEQDVYRGYSKTEEKDYKDFDNMSDCIAENLKCSLYYHQNDPILWRIIGVFEENQNYYVKLIRADSIGKFSWDSSSKEINEGLGINEWSESDLYHLLNTSAFYQKATGECMIKEQNFSAPCSFQNNGLSKQAQDFIQTSTWHLGSLNEELIKTKVVSDWVQKERENHEKLCTEGIYCTDTLERKSQLEAQIGLLSPSDVAYATSKKECYSTPISKWEPDCFKTNYLAELNSKIWLLNPYSSHDSNGYGLQWDQKAGVKSVFVDVAAEVYPVIYLKRTVKIVGGYGTKEKPYQISMK